MNDKTVRIVRPEGLNKFRRRLLYTAPTLSFDYRDLSIDKMNEILWAMVPLQNKSSVHTQTKILFNIALNNQVMIVSKEVSRALEASSLSCRIDHLVWPCPAMEIIFEDPDLPALGFTQNELLGCEKIQPIGKGFSGLLHDKESFCIFGIVSEKNWDIFSKDPEYLYESDTRQRSDLMDPLVAKSESLCLHYMICLCMKVLAYASVPRHAPSLLTTRQERKEAGIHPKHDHNKSKAMVVKYLPVVHRDSPRSESTPDGSSHRFMGRRGHIRYYEADRYVKMKGQWQWMPPIAPPEGIKVIYKVRTVPADATPDLVLP